MKRLGDVKSPGNPGMREPFMKTDLPSVFHVWAVLPVTMFVHCDCAASSRCHP